MKNNRYFSLVIASCWVTQSTQWLVHPSLEKDFQFFAQKDQKIGTESSQSQKKKKSILGLRSQDDSAEPSVGASPFPFDFDRGYIDIYEQEGNCMWYWHFRAMKNPETAPLILWFDGGPGGASSGDVFTSNGPFKFENYSPKDPIAYFKNTTWSQVANVVYPDFPLGVGFSNVTTGHVSFGKDQVMEQILIFFTKFLKKYPEYKKRPLYIGGVSYGGHWVPYVATALKYSGNPDINIQGFYISDGMIHAQTLLETYPDFALQNFKYTGFTQQDAENVGSLKDLCLHSFTTRLNRLYTKGYFSVCLDVYGAKIYKTIHQKRPKFSRYSMPGGYPFDGTFIEFLNTTSIQTFLGALHKDFQFVNNTFGNMFAPRDFYVDVRPMLARLLDDGVKGVFTVGNLDFICNSLQSEQTVADLKWKHQKAYNMASRKPCKYGYCKGLANLREYRVTGSGHGTSVYKPEFTLEIIESLINWNP